MEVDNENNPSQIKSLPNIVDLKKKRKLEAEQLGLPVSKHQCWKQILPLEMITPCTFNGKGVVDVYDVSEFVSDKDSNSFPGNSDSTMSSPTEAKFGTTTETKHSLHDIASSSSDWSSDGTTVASGRVEKEVVLFSPTDVEQAENHIDHIYSGYRNYAQQTTRKPTIDQEFEQYFSMLML